MGGTRAFPVRATLTRGRAPLGVGMSHCTSPRAARPPVSRRSAGSVAPAPTETARRRLRGLFVGQRTRPGRGPCMHLVMLRPFGRVRHKRCAVSPVSQRPQRAHF